MNPEKGAAKPRTILDTWAAREFRERRRSGRPAPSGAASFGAAVVLAGDRRGAAGVRLVTINWMFFRPDGNPLNPWDNHGGTPALGGKTGYEMLKADYCIPPLVLRQGSYDSSADGSARM